jgi:hypothetical protein
MLKLWLDCCDADKWDGYRRDQLEIYGMGFLTDSRHTALHACSLSQVHMHELQLPRMRMRSKRLWALLQTTLPTTRSRTPSC